MEIRRINRSESDLVVDLFNKYRIFYQQPSDINLAHHFIQARLDHNESIIFVAFIRKNDKTIPVGFTQLYPAYSSVRAVRDWILNDLFVEEAYRKQGIGEALIRTVMEFARKNKATFVELSTAVNNFTAQRLYESVGFRKQEPDKEFFTYRINVD